jgi:hypothetical protein
MWAKAKALKELKEAHYIAENKTWFDGIDKNAAVV